MPPWRPAANHEDARLLATLSGPRARSSSPSHPPRPAASGMPVRRRVHAGIASIAGPRRPGSAASVRDACARASEPRGVRAGPRHEEHLLGLHHRAARRGHRRGGPAGRHGAAAPEAARRRRALGGGGVPPQRRRLGTVGMEPRGEEGADGAVVGEAGLAARVPVLVHPLAAPQDAVAPAQQNRTDQTRVSQAVGRRSTRWLVKDEALSRLILSVTTCVHA